MKILFFKYISLLTVCPAYKQARVQIGVHKSFHLMWNRRYIVVFEQTCTCMRIVSNLRRRVHCTVHEKCIEVDLTHLKQM